MTSRIPALILLFLPQVCGWSWSRDAHGSRIWFTNSGNVSVDGDPSRLQLFTKGVIVAEVTRNETDEIIACRFTEVRDAEERKWLYGKLGRIPKAVTFDEMTQIIEKCGDSVVSTSYYLPRFTNPVFPGTMWCGPGDAATDYGSLGYFPGPDACCRNHDLCPIRSLPGEAITPRGPNRFTLSDCRCDHALRACLTKNSADGNSYTASLLKRLVEMSLSYCLAEDGNVVQLGY
ncbi:uncharacterized protein LOC100900375 [Galendromus occidentalis]|uniref:Uncharacterized protein LOC100900375 n=1 Tax=Galendromus occidentalis TaxID=34638 RepID=A0AAJ6QMF4_9ACAR|nr:uncharacterized protein LOC100900375 [Galendromus occidentalis]